MIQSFNLEAQGFGFILCSPFATADISDGEDFLESNFEQPSDVEKLAKECSIVGVSTGSPGNFLFEIYYGYPTDDTLEKFEFRLRLGVEVRGKLLEIRDLFDLMDWTKNCPKEQTIKLNDDGFYHITLLSKLPKSGLLGDKQKVLVFLHHLDSKPDVDVKGVPTLC